MIDEYCDFFCFESYINIGDFKLTWALLNIEIHNIWSTKLIDLYNGIYFQKETITNNKPRYPCLRGMISQTTPIDSLFTMILAPTLLLLSLLLFIRTFCLVGWYFKIHRKKPWFLTQFHEIWACIIFLFQMFIWKEDILLIVGAPNFPNICGRSTPCHVLSFITLWRCLTCIILRAIPACPPAYPEIMPWRRF